jgi:hypothetical protein
MNYDIVIAPLYSDNCIIVPVVLSSNIPQQKRPSGHFTYQKVITKYTGLKLIRSLDEPYMWVGKAGLWSAKVWKNPPYTSAEAGFGYEILKRASVVLKGHQTYGSMSNILTIENFINRSINEMVNQYR